MLMQSWAAQDDHDVGTSTTREIEAAFNKFNGPIGEEVLRWLSSLKWPKVGPESADAAALADAISSIFTARHISFRFQ